MKRRWAILVGLAVLVALAASASPTATGAWKSRLARAHGFDRWSEVDAVRFTFTAGKFGISVTRSWFWDVRTNIVTYEADKLLGGTKTVTYDRDELATADKSARDIDAKFINDTFWLLWPLHLTWSDDPTITDAGSAESPIAKAPARKLVIAYPKEGGGYTPGDSYTLYLDESERPIEWTYQPGSAFKPSLTCTWGRYRSAGPLTLSTDHTDAGGSFRLTITDLAVRVTGSVEWIEAASPSVDR